LQCTGVSHAQSFRDDVTRVASVAGRDIALHGLVPSSTGDGENAFAPVELITRCLWAIEEEQGSGREAVHRALKCVADFARESGAQPLHGCTARNTILSELAGDLAGDLSALPVIRPDAPLQWSKIPQQLNKLLQSIHDKSGSQDAALEQDACSLLVPLSRDVHSWTTPIECVTAALAHAVKRALSTAETAVCDALMHCYASKNLRSCAATNLVVKVLAEEAAAAVAAAAACAQDAAPGPSAFGARGADKWTTDVGGVYTYVLNSNALR
jgi:hypothetical protein